MLLATELSVAAAPMVTNLHPNLLALQGFDLILRSWLANLEILEFLETLS